MTLPDPATCTWLEAEDTALVLNALADDIGRQMGPRPTKGWKSKHRWDGRSTVLSQIRYRAMLYRLRQGALMEEGQ